jgi:hypothetical protein
MDPGGVVGASIGNVVWTPTSVTTHPHQQLFTVIYKTVSSNPGCGLEHFLRKQGERAYDVLSPTAWGMPEPLASYR